MYEFDSSVPLFESLQGVNERGVAFDAVDQQPRSNKNVSTRMHEDANNPDAGRGVDAKTRQRQRATPAKQLVRVGWRLWPRFRQALV